MAKLKECKGHLHKPNPCRIVDGGAECVECRGFVPNRFDEVGAIIAFESGELSEDGILELFQHLVNNGHAWSLQGSYGRTARALIEAGHIQG